MNLEYVLRDCPVCGRSNRDPFFCETVTPFIEGKQVPVSVSVTVCDDCGLVYNDRAPSAASLKHVYRFLFRTPVGRSERHKKKNRSQIGFLAPHLAASGALALDVGSALDPFAAQLREMGHEAYELEPSKELVEKCAQGDPRVINAAIEDFDSPLRFDLIALREVFEHLSDPLAALDVVSRHLAPRGLAYIDVPDLARAHPCGAESYFNFLHLWHFTETSLANLVAKAGFAVVARRTDPVYESIRLLLQKDPGAARACFTPDGRARELIADYFALESRELALARGQLTELLSRGGKLVLWGAGFRTEALLRRCIPDLAGRVDCLIDSDRAKQGTDFCGKRIQPPAYCLTTDSPVVISSSPSSEEAIEKAMLDMGVAPGRIVKMFEHRVRRIA
ncbi:MAG: methyltransferase domain-containing protein [Desulfovibrionaceae bacterium]|nr:methyltransferase domain-containing protein [Desulfovibrionaceae bacterium]MBF0512650.1 methyltransferase domain-containing protein [Desulfovibrionaceae bacterium]